MRNLQKGKDSVRTITHQDYFGCYDTTNFIPIKISGATAGFEVVTDNVCFKSPVSFRDTSNAENTTIVSRQWNFGDGQTQTVTNGGVVSHLYSNPGMYYVSLKITDASGCSSTTNYTTHAVSVNGPKAAFSVSEVNAHLNATIHFYNNTNNYNSYNTQYEWQFGDGNTSNEYYPSYTYTKPGNYKIRLIAKNPDSGCTDTAYQEITVKNFNANFSFASSFVNSIECSPTLVQFRNTSYDYSHVTWDFGDGFTSDNINYPSHVYTKPGKYIIKLFVTGYNGLSHTYIDSVFIKSNKVDITADVLHSCTSQSVTLSALTGDAASYLWDFGDGTIVQATDTFSVHEYKRPGVYVPRLIAKDDNGCATPVILADKIVIDSLYLSLNNLPGKICTPKDILFNPVVVNIAADQAQQSLIYHWDFGTGSKADTSNIKTPSFVYQQPGNYSVSLKVQSPYGCVKEVKADVVALQGLGGQINGPSEICQESTAQFTGTTQLPGQPLWRWVFDDGTIIEEQNPPSKKYDKAGSFSIQLIVDNKGCADTVTRTLEVHPKPAVSLSVKQASLCEGSGINITAGGGNSYTWSPAAGLNSATGATVTASPLNNTDYVVTAISAYGCENTDTVKIAVVHPFQLQLATEAAVCFGESIPLKASGAVTYQWIGNTTDLNNTAIPNPVATPSNTITYTVAATGENQCFSDTASIKIIVKPVPSVDAGPGAEILAGATYQLQATASNDVVKWDWSPAKYLSCLNCATPKATPLEPMNYTVTVSNAQGCTASDTVSVKLFCSESRINIPNAFTPNNDGINDQFFIKGQGITTLNHLRIYNSWGTLVFERTNLKIDDKSAAWDGKYKGEPVPMGVYVYFVEMSCNERTFTQKGVVTVVY
jgi:gliding motility-associated-like protein